MNNYPLFNDLNQHKKNFNKYIICFNNGSYIETELETEFIEFLSKCNWNIDVVTIEQINKKPLMLNLREITYVQAVDDET